MTEKSLTGGIHLLVDGVGIIVGALLTTLKRTIVFLHSYWIGALILTVVIVLVLAFRGGVHPGEVLRWIIERYP